MAGLVCRVVPMLPETAIKRRAKPVDRKVLAVKFLLLMPQSANNLFPFSDMLIALQSCDNRPRSFQTIKA